MQHKKPLIGGFCQPLMSSAASADPLKEPEDKSKNKRTSAPGDGEGEKKNSRDSTLECLGVKRVFRIYKFKSVSSCLWTDILSSVLTLDLVKLIPISYVV